MDLAFIDKTECRYHIDLQYQHMIKTKKPQRLRKLKDIFGNNIQVMTNNMKLIGDLIYITLRKDGVF